MYYGRKYNFVENLVGREIKCFGGFNLVGWNCYISVMECFSEISIIDKIEGDNFSWKGINIDLFKIKGFSNVI